MATASPDSPSSAGRPATYWIESLIYSQTRQQATDALLSLGNAAIPALQEEQKSPNNRVREESALVLKQIVARLPAG